MGALLTITSADGTTIAAERDGGGPGLVLVTGALNDRSSSADLAATLSDRFTVYRFDRRGRGDSTDTAPWSVPREIEDLAAVIEAAGHGSAVYGHSSGAALALEAAAAGVPMRRLCAYEAPYTGGAGATEGRAAELERLVADGHPDEATALFLHGTGMPDSVVEQMRGAPVWQRLIAFAPTLAYDVRLVAPGSVPRQRLTAVAIPVLALAGGASPGWAPAAAQEIAAVIPRAEWRTLDGQTHQVAPDVLAPVLADFLR